jgi:hypothetical protein
MTDPPPRAGAPVTTVRAGAFVTLFCVCALAWAWRQGVAPTAPRLAAPELAKVWTVLRALASVALIDLAALGLTAPLGAFLPPGGRLRRVALRLAGGLVLLGTLLGTLGVLGLFSPTAVIATVAALAAVGVAVAWRCAQEARRLPVPRSSRVMLGLAAALCALPAMHAFVPLYGWDALTYHLALPEAFLRAGRIAFDPRSVYTAFPLLVESLYAAGLALHGPAAAKLLHLQCLVVAALLLADVARQRAPRAWPLAPLSLLADPTVLWEATVAYNDLALVLFAVALLDALLASREPDDPRAGWRAALFAGACVATRYPGALVPLAFAAPFLLDRATPLRERARRAATLASGAALLAPWLLRNAHGGGGLFGLSALHPLFLEQMRAFNADIGAGRDLSALLLAPWRLVFHDHPDRYSGGFGYLLGPLHLAGLAALVAGAIPRAAPRMGVAALCFYVGWFLSVQEARYLLALLPLLGLASACAMSAAWPTLPRLIRVAVALSAAVAVAAVLTRASASYRHALPVALGRVTPSRMARLDVAERVGDQLRASLPRGARLLPLFESRAWHLRGLRSVYFHVNQGAPVWAELHDARRRRGLCAWLAAEGLTHVLLNLPAYQHTPPTATARYTDADIVADMRAVQMLLQASADALLRDGGVTVWTLRPGRCVEPPLP